MITNYIDTKSFIGTDFSAARLPIGEYDQCTFTKCNFENSDISNCVFIDCEFEACNLSNSSTKHTSFQEVRFKECKVIGVKFNQCNDFLLALNFNNCQLNLSSFYKLKLIGTQFNLCKLHEVDFTESNLDNSNFDHSDLLKALFDTTNLEKSDFRLAYNYTINPDQNKLKGAKFSRKGIEGLLQRHSIIIE